MRVPATYLIKPGRRLAPPQISVPALLAVQVTLIDRDGHAHQVVLKTLHQHVLSVPAGGHVSLLLPGMKAGRFPLELDGHAAGVLVIGGEPGP